MITLNNKKINFTEFPNGETHIESQQIEKAIKLGNPYPAIIKFKYENDSDLIRLMFIKKHLDSRNHETTLIMLYAPYSRMDRGEGMKVFTLKYITDFINSLNFKKVIVYQPHSDVTPALLNNCEVINMSEKLLRDAMGRMCFNKERDYIYYPDASAEKHFRQNGFNSLIGMKQRDFETGNIIGLKIAGDPPKEKGFKVIMIDDLCSKGTTFIKGAEKLKDLGADEIYLVVTHCEKTIFEGNIFSTDLIDRVFTTNSIIDKKHKCYELYIDDILNLEE